MRRTATGVDLSPRFAVWARHLGKPDYVRRVISEGEREVTLTGLGPGRFRLLWVPVGQGGVLMEPDGAGAPTIDVDGVSDATWEIHAK